MVAKVCIRALAGTCAASNTNLAMADSLSRSNAAVAPQWPVRAPGYPSDGGVAVFPDDRPWFVAQVHSRAEKAVADRLNALRMLSGLRIEADALCHTVERKTSKNKRLVEVPLFSMYVFVRCYKRDIHRYVLSDPSVSRLLTFIRDDQRFYAVVPHSKITSLRIYLEHMHDEIEVLPPMLEKGMLVRVMEGQLAGLEGTVVTLKNDSSEVRIQIDMLGAVPVLVPTSIVQPIDSPSSTPDAADLKD